MRLHEALETGLEYRRTSWPESNGWISPDADDQSAIYTPKEILATDWEVREPSVTLTRQDFWNAYAKATKAEGYRDHAQHTVDRMCDELFGKGPGK